jgi:hypothetical protein
MGSPAAAWPGSPDTRCSSLSSYGADMRPSLFLWLAGRIRLPRLSPSDPAGPKGVRRRHLVSGLHGQVEDNASAALARACQIWPALSAAPARMSSMFRHAPSPGFWQCLGALA